MHYVLVVHSGTLWRRLYTVESALLTNNWTKYDFTGQRQLTKMFGIPSEIASV